MYIKYYGIFKFKNNQLIGFGHNHGWYTNLIYPFVSYDEAYKYFITHQHYLEFKDTFILKISGRYFTSIFKKYNKLYRINWKTFIYYRTQVSDYKTPNFNYFKYNIFYKEIEI